MLNDVPIRWCSKSQRSLMLSSRKAGYFSLSVAAKEMKFIWMLLKIMSLEVKLPITVTVDSVGAIFMS